MFHLFKVYTRIRSQSVTWTIREVEMGKERDVEVREKSAVYSGIGDLIHAQFFRKAVCSALCLVTLAMKLSVSTDQQEGPLAGVQAFAPVHIILFLFPESLVPLPVAVIS